MINRILFILTVSFPTSALIAGAGHDHGSHPEDEQQDHSDEPAALQESGSGDTFEYVWTKPDGRFVLYLNDVATNSPLENVQVEFVMDQKPDDAHKFEMVEAGIFQSADFVARPMGQLIITYQDGEIDVADVAFAETQQHHHQLLGHSHTLFYLGFALLFCFGLALGFFVRKRRNANPTSPSPETQRTYNGAAAVLLAIGAGLGASVDLHAHEGHSHAEAEIGGASTGVGEISLPKKSQFIIGLRTAPVFEQESPAVYKTFGHIMAPPQYDAWLRAPRQGIISYLADITIGSSVKRGQVLAKIDALGTIEMRAPFDGVVLGFNAVKGVRVGSDEKLFRVVNRDTLWVDAEVYQRDLGGLGAPDKAFVGLDGSDRLWDATYVGIRTAVEEDNLNTHIYFKIENADHSLALGATAGVEIETAKKLRGFEVPKAAVLRRGAETIVFVKTGVETFEERPVAVHTASGGDSYVVTKGLQKGDRIVTTGAYQLLVGAN